MVSEHSVKLFFIFILSLAVTSSICTIADAFPGTGRPYKPDGGGSSNKLEFVTEPWRTSAVNMDFPIQPQVAVVDSSHNIVTTATDNVTISAYTNSTCTTAAGGSFSADSTSIAATNGVATFAGADYSAAGTIYLKATSGSMSSACSNPIYVIHPPTLESTVSGSTTGATSVTATTNLTTTSADTLLVATVATNSTCTSAGSELTIGGSAVAWSGTFGTNTNSGLQINQRTFLTTSTYTNKVVAATLSCSGPAVLILSAFKYVTTTDDFGKGIGYSERNTFGNSSPITETSVRDYELAVYGAVDTATLTSAEGTLIANLGSGSFYGAQARTTTPISTAGSSFTYGYSGTASNGMGGAHFLIPAAPAFTVPTLDQTYANENGGGSATMGVRCGAQAPNELLLLAVTWRDAGDMTVMPAKHDLASTRSPTTWTAVGSATLRGTTKMQVFRAFTTAAFNDFSQTVSVTVPGSAKATAICASFRGVNTTGTNGSGAIDATSSASGATANPSNTVATLTNEALVVSFLGTGNTTMGTDSGYSTVHKSIASTGGGGPTSKATTNLTVKNATTNTPRTVTQQFGWSATDDWVMQSIAIKP